MPGDEPQSIIIEPDYPSLARWFARAISMQSFDMEKGNEFVAGFVDVIRYLAQTQPEEIKKLLGELRAETD